MEFKQKFIDFWKKYGIKSIIIIIAIIMLIFIGKYYANKEVKDIVNNAKNEWYATVGKGFQDNLSKLQQRQEDLDSSFNAQKADIIKIKNDNKKNIKDVFNGNDTNRMSQLFDSTIDSVELEK